MVDTKQMRFYSEMLRREGKSEGALAMKQAADEVDRLRDLLDRRPAMNADLPDSYARWSSECCQSDMACVLAKKP